MGFFRVAFAESDDLAGVQYKRVEALCPVGAHVTGGGFGLNNFAFQVVGSRKVTLGSPEQEGWAVEVSNPDLAGGSFNVMAVCVEPPPADASAEGDGAG